MNYLRTTKRGYSYDKRIFWGVFSLVIVLILYIFASYNFDFTPKLYFNCTAPKCDNPFYLTECKQQLTVLFFIPLWTSSDCGELPEYQWLKNKKLPFGEYGTPPPEDFLLNNIRVISILILIGGFLLNHFIHNKNKKFDIEIPVTKKIILNRDWLAKTLKRVENEENKNNK